VVTTITVPAAVPFSTPGTRGDDNAVHTGRHGFGTPAAGLRGARLKSQPCNSTGRHWG
jgi:hypothetical protein